MVKRKTNGLLEEGVVIEGVETLVAGVDGTDDGVVVVPLGVNVVEGVCPAHKIRNHLMTIFIPKLFNKRNCTRHTLNKIAFMMHMQYSMAKIIVFSYT